MRLVPAGLLLCTLLIATQVFATFDTPPEPATPTPAGPELGSVPSESAVVEPSPTPTAEPIPTLTPLPLATALPTITSTPTSPPPSPTATISLPTPTAAAPEPTWVTDELGAALNGVVEVTEGLVGVAVAAPDGALLYEHNASESMEAASIYKLAVMAELYRQREAGLLTFDDLIVLSEAYYVEGPDSFSWSDIGVPISLDRLLFAMIAQSSNVASYALLDLLGNDPINAMMQALDLYGIEIRWRPANPAGLIYVPANPEPSDGDADRWPGDGPVSRLDEPGSGYVAVSASMRADVARNVVTAIDVARLLGLIVRGELVNEKSSAEMLDLLGRQQIFGGLPLLLDEGTVAHKTGYLPDGVVNDAGVLQTPGGPFVAVVLTEHVPDYIAHQIAAEVGLLVFEYGKTVMPE